jgi:hypothetical protein
MTPRRFVRAIQIPQVTHPLGAHFFVILPSPS